MPMLVEVADEGMAYIIHHVSIPEAINLIREDCPTTILDHAVLANGMVPLSK